MKLSIPITLFISSSVLVACDNGASISGNEVSNVATPNVVGAVFRQTAENTRNVPEEWFDEAEALATTGQDEIFYLEQLGALLTHYVDITNASGYPTGLNYEITNQLLGQNVPQIALMDSEHPKVNDSGEIVDSWGTPYYFHSEASLDISIQSAGPDLLQYTDDDIVYEELNRLAGVGVVVADTDSNGTGLLQGAANQATPASTFDTYESGGHLPE